jgi:signal transduction histidine kinase
MDEIKVLASDGFQVAPSQVPALLEAILAVSSDLSLAETLQHIVAAAAHLVDARYAALGVPDETGTYLAEFITTGLTNEEEARIGHRPRGHGILGVIMHEGQSLRLRDLTEHPRSYGFPPNHPPMKSFLGVPVRHKGVTLGNLYLTDKRTADEFSADDQALVELLATHAGLAIDHARLHSQLQQMRVVEERQRISMDLHDGIIQSIYAVGLILEYVDAQVVEGDTAGARERLRQAISGLNDTIRDIRSYILDLRPRRFEGNDLVAGLQVLLSEFKANTLITVDFTAGPNVNQALTPEARLALFHIAQEALSNAAKHSRASHMQVALLEADQGITLSLKDNGQGFKPRASQRRLGHGLNNMQERVGALGGQLDVRSPEGQGTEVLVTLPLGNNRAE